MLASAIKTITRTYRKGFGGAVATLTYTHDTRTKRPHVVSLRTGDYPWHHRYEFVETARRVWKRFEQSLKTMGYQAMA